MTTTDIPPEVMKLAGSIVKKSREAAWPDLTGMIARIISDAGTFTPKPEPTRGMIAATKVIYVSGPDWIRFDGPLPTRLSTINGNRDVCLDGVLACVAAIADAVGAAATKAERERCKAVVSGREPYKGCIDLDAGAE